MKRTGVFCLIFVFFVAGCATEYKIPDLGGLYSKVASSPDLYKTRLSLFPVYSARSLLIENRDVLSGVLLMEAMPILRSPTVLDFLHIL